MTLRIIWVLGCREGSNIIASIIEGCGAVGPGVTRKPMTPDVEDWNDVWAEDNYLLQQATAILGTEEHFCVQKQMRPAEIDPVPIKAIAGYLRAELIRAGGKPLVVKFGTLPLLWSALAPFLVDVTHELVFCRRNRASRVRSLLAVKLHAGRTEKQAHDFFDRYDEARHGLMQQFLSENRTVLSVSLEECKDNVRILWQLAEELGLAPSDSAVALFRPERVRS